METINTTEEVKEQFEKERMMHIGKEAKAFNQSQFLEILIKHWRN